MTSFMFPSATEAASLTPSQIDSIVALLASFNAESSVIESVRTSLSGTELPTRATASISGVSVISHTPVKGSTHPEVKVLQWILNSDPDTRVAETGVGSRGNENTFFGPGTLRALKKFQEKHGLSGPGEQGYGVIGPRTKAKLNEIAVTAR